MINIEFKAMLGYLGKIRSIQKRRLGALEQVKFRESTQKTSESNL